MLFDVSLGKRRNLLNLNLRKSRRYQNFTSSPRLCCNIESCELLTQSEMFLCAGRERERERERDAWKATSSYSVVLSQWHHGTRKDRTHLRTLLKKISPRMASSVTQASEVHFVMKWRLRRGHNFQAVFYGKLPFSCALQ